MKEIEKAKELIGDAKFLQAIEILENNGIQCDYEKERLTKMETQSKSYQASGRTYDIETENERFETMGIIIESLISKLP